MQNKLSLTIIIPCHQVDDRFMRSLSLSKWVTHMLIIDQNTGYDWQKIRQQFPVKIINHPKLKSFAAMRNQAMQEVETMWCFFLDSDEFYQKNLPEEISRTIHDTVYDAFSIIRSDIFLGKPIFHGEAADVKIIRLVKKGAGTWKGDAHEVFVPNHSEKIGQLKHVLYHEPHPSIHSFIQKINRYTDILAQGKQENQLLLRSIAMPICKFFYTFIVKYGFLDGYRGLIYSLVMSIHSSAVRIKRYERK